MSFKLLPFFAFITLTALACEPEPTTRRNDNGEEIVAKELAETEDPQGGNMCFEQNEEGVKTTLNLTINGGEVSGIMSVVPNGKNASSGTLVGTREGNILKVVYNYTIEGSAEAEEKQFKLDGDKLWIMIGEMTQKEDFYRFKDRSKGEYRESLAKVECVLGAK